MFKIRKREGNVNITPTKVVSNHRSSSGRGESTAKLLGRTRSKKLCLRSAAFEPDRRSVSRNLGRRRQRPSICHALTKRAKWNRSSKGRRRLGASVAPQTPVLSASQPSEALKVDEWLRQIDVISRTSYAPAALPPQRQIAVTL